MGQQIFLNQSTVTVDICTQMINALSNREKKNAVINQPFIHATIIISVMNKTVRNQVCASDVDWRIILLQIVQNRTLRIKKFTGTRKIFKIVRTDKIKYIRHWKNSTDESKSHNVYASMAHVSTNAEITRNKYGDKLQLTNCILEKKCNLSHGTRDLGFYTRPVCGNR